MIRRVLVATAYFLPFCDSLHNSSAPRAISLMQNDFSASHQFKKRLEPQRKEVATGTEIHLNSLIYTGFCRFRLASLPNQPTLLWA
jgi:nitrogen fixation protein FixH